MRPVFRPDPRGPVAAYQTYAINSPADVTIKAACQQVSCEGWRLGWESHIDEKTDLGKAQAEYIRHQSGRTFKEKRRPDGVTVFAFDSGQRCFREHHTRPETFFTRGGDWRRNLGLIRQHTRPIDWVEDFAEHQDRLNTAIKRG